jgi:hypothetical protein
MTRLTSFSILAASWAMWLLAGFSAGGVVVVLERAITLVRESSGYRRLAARTTAFVSARLSARAVALRG